jgi:hypothetical protein
MTEWVVLSDAAYALATAILFAFVGRGSGRRDAQGSDRLALSMFRAWWFGVAIFVGLGGVWSVLDVLAPPQAPLQFAMAVISMLSVCVAVWGLLFYVTYLYTGRTGSFLFGLGFYGLVFSGMVYALAADPTGRELTAWHQSIVRLAILTGPLLSAIIVVFLLPALGALLAYVRLYGRVETRGQRFRLGLSTGSLIVWFGLAILAWVAGVAHSLVWVYVGRILALLAALAVLVAYVPPRWVVQRLRLATEVVLP